MPASVYDHLMIAGQLALLAELVRRKRVKIEMLSKWLSSLEPDELRPIQLHRLIAIALEVLEPCMLAVTGDNNGGQKCFTELQGAMAAGKVTSQALINFVTEHTARPFPL